ncbi:hypothetical protein BU23DRAFT_234267 [Bimuria novae-zelandiae CBS 107.79]|uniref:Uncharacterized protein n=1 Tax=Bimuria novae-zelandiae CBS 107.79 TaxID=1447943 RepID=A0A6A5UYI8_9PLEO|nr:hypothetical protein BU23DRAFT_234267 [Bimuria novae-zelandiae CBS 107.79]
MSLWMSIFGSGTITTMIFHGCDNTATVKQNNTDAEQSFASNYTGWKDSVTEQEPSAASRLCTIRKHGFPDLQVWINIEREKNSLYPNIGVFDTENELSGYQTGIIRAEWSKADREFRLFAAPKITFYWTTKINVPQVQYCVGNHENILVTRIKSWKIDMPGLSAWSCFQSTSNLTLVTEREMLGLINGTISHCKLDYCAKTHHDISFRPNVVTYCLVSEMPLHSTGPNFTRNEYGWDFGFRISTNDANDDLENIVSNFSRLYFGSSFQRVLESTTISTFLMPYFEANLTWSDFFHGVAEVGSKVL